MDAMNARSGLMETFKITNGSSDISRYILNPMMLEEEGIIKKIKRRSKLEGIPGTAPSHALSGVHTPFVVIRESGLTITQLEPKLYDSKKCLFSNRIVDKWTALSNSCMDCTSLNEC